MCLCVQQQHTPETRVKTCERELMIQNNVPCTLYPASSTYTCSDEEMSRNKARNLMGRRL